LAAIAPKTADGKADLTRAFTDADLDLVSRAVIKQCAGHDGTDDQLITDPEACQFDPASLQCSGDKADDCLSAPQVTALHKIFGGAKGKDGTALYSPWLYDSGIGSPGWRVWKMGNAKTPALNLILGGLSTKYVFMTPPSADFDILTTPVDDIYAAVAATDAAYKTSALDFMVADKTALEPFLKHKGKLILYHGVSDPVFSALDTIRYYKKLQEKYQGGTTDFARLFLVPGMNHCGGGQYALDSFDTLDPIVAWVERGKAPDRLVATASTDAHSGSRLRPGLSRPLCPYPQTPHYRGTGNGDEAAAFDCR
jgi:feruloyl esterase